MLKNVKRFQWKIEEKNRFLLHFLELRKLFLTDTWIMIYYIKYFITSSFHVIIWTDAAEHGRETKIGPRFVARVSVEEKSKGLESLKSHLSFQHRKSIIEKSIVFTNPQVSIDVTVLASSVLFTLFHYFYYYYNPFTTDKHRHLHELTCLPFDICSHELYSVSWSLRRVLCIFFPADTRIMHDCTSVRHQLDKDLSLKLK